MPAAAAPPPAEEDLAPRPVAGRARPAITECIICIQRLTEQDRPMFLPCCHGPFHRQCLTRTLQATHGQCPVCRYFVPKAEREDVPALARADPGPEAEVPPAGPPAAAENEAMDQV